MNLETDSPESLAWQAERNAAAAAHLQSRPAYEQLRSRLTGLLADSRCSTQLRRGDRWFSTTVIQPEDEHPGIVVRTSPTGEPRVLVDLNELTAKRGVPVSLFAFAPSPDGSVLAYTVNAAGTEFAELGLVDVATGTPLPDEVTVSVSSQLQWLPDSSGFWFTSREIRDGAYHAPLYCYLLGEPLPAETPVPSTSPFVAPQISPDGRYLAIVTGNTELRADHVVVDGEVRPLLEGVPGQAVVRFHGDDLVAILDDTAPRGRLVRIPIATSADRSTWTELVPESHDVLRSLEVVDGAIVLGYLRDAASRVRVLDLDGGVVDELSLPGDGVVSTVPFGASHPALPMFAAGDGEISFLFSAPDRSWASYRYLVAERRLEVVTPPAVVIPGLTISTVIGTSADGEQVPAHVVHRADLDLASPRPTIVHGYGGFNVAHLPAYLPEAAAWVEAGGIFVIAHLRGGSDFGAEWWRAGMRDRKQSTFDDLYAVAERLVELGWTTPAQLTVKGESNGGLLAGAAAVQRPDLWAAVVADVPVLDLLGMQRDPLTYAIGKVEYGDPADPVEAEWLRALSPVHNVRPADYPAVLVTAGANDPRCPAWHSRVFVDLVDRANTGDQPILLRVYADQGHGAAGLAATASKVADWLALAASATGLEV